MPELNKATDITFSKWLDDFGIKETGGSRYEDKAPPTLRYVTSSMTGVNS